jgi:pimeloyl-ACP methyl ester carboxylesterase
VDSTLLLDGRSWMVRQSGDLDGRAVVYFHGTPSSRLEPAYADAAAAELGVRLVCFDRPGYGGSTAAGFGLASVAASTGAIADRLRVDRFATLGQSGGGPFALACAAVLGDGVTRVAVTSGAIPFQRVPGALDRLDEEDAAALALLPDRTAAAAGLASGFEPFREQLRGPDGPILAAFRARHSPRDNEILEWPGVAAGLLRSLRESMVAGPSGGGWDNVAWIGEWDIDLSDVRQPVDLWYGGDDGRHPPGDAEWLAEHLPDATLHLVPESGHLLVIEHISEILTTLTAD